jgi:DNA-binding NarL/FixJ family response regulator
MLYSVLFLEDSPQYAMTMKRILMASTEMFVEIAESPGEASRLIAKQRFDAIVVDVSLGEGKSYGTTTLQGDEWLAQNYERCRGARCFLITAFPGRIKRAKELIARDVRMMIKSKDDQELCDVIVGAARERGGVPRSKEVLDTPAGAIEKEAQRLLNEWLVTTYGGAEERLWIGGRAYGLEELRAEVESPGSEVGRQLVLRVIRYLRRLATPSAERSE